MRKKSPTDVKDRGVVLDYVVPDHSCLGFAELMNLT